jgi:hypothetical protein
MRNEFDYQSIEIVVKDKINHMNIIQLTNREYRRSNDMFFSRLSTYNQLGYIFNNSFHLLKKYMKCINCYSNYENDSECKYCGYEYSESKMCFFLNCRNIMPSNTYKNLKKKYNLNTISEYYYDQRHKISRFLKEEIYAKALHPDRIEKILELSGDSWINLDDYI